MAALTPQQEAYRELVEKALRLQDARSSAGWPDVLDSLENRVAQAEFHLLNYNGSDEKIIVALRQRARAMRELFQNFQKDIEVQIRESLQTTSSPQPDSEDEVVGGQSW